MTFHIVLLIFCSLRLTNAGYDCIRNCSCEYHKSLIAHCDDANYHVIPIPDIPYPIHTLYLQNNRIEVLRDQEFLHLNHLEELVLHGNRIHTIEDGAFDGLESLRILDLSRNQLSSIPSKELDKLTFHLVKLSIAENVFHDLPEGISTLASLEDFDFSGNELISDIPTNVLPPFLTELHMSNTGIRHMKRSMLANQSNLRLLEFGKPPGSYEVTFEENFFDAFHSLEYVGLSGHSLAGLPNNEFSRLTNLKALILINCGLELFPELYTVEEGSGFGYGIPFFNETNSSTIHPNSHIAWHNSKLNILDLSRNPNISIDSDNVHFPPLLTNLRLAYTSIPIVDNELFEGVTKLESLDLQYSNIRTIAFDAFVNLRNLTEIWLSGNPIEAAPHLPASLTFLGCHSTGMKHLTREPFSKLTGVVEANFSNSQIESILDFTFGHMVSLRILDLSGNKIVNLSKDTLAIGIFRSPHGEAADTSHLKSSLSDLILSSCTISKIEQRAFETHVRLKRLYLQMNHITALQEGIFTGLDILSLLNLNDNGIRDLAPGAFSGLRNLKELFLENNQLEVIFSQTFNDLWNLRRLHLERNNIKIFHATSISTLEYVDISHNQLLDFPQVGAGSVLEMDASMNPISQIDTTALQILFNLQDLNISYCRLKNIDYKVFSNSQRLISLDLSGNRIVNFLDQKLPQLKELYLKDNNIESVDSVSFLRSVVPNIKKLDLSENPLEHLDGAFFDGAFNLQALNLSGTNLVCDCSLVPLIKWMRNDTNIRDNIDEYTCGDPPRSIATVLDDADCYSHEKVGISKASVYIAICVALVLVAMVLLVMTWCLCRRIRKRSINNNVVGLDGGLTLVQASDRSCTCCCLSSGYSRSRGRFQSEESRDLVEHVTSPIDKEAPIPL